MFANDIEKLNSLYSTKVIAESNLGAAGMGEGIGQPTHTDIIASRMDKMQVPKKSCPKCEEGCEECECTCGKCKQRAGEGAEDSRYTTPEELQNAVQNGEVSAEDLVNAVMALPEDMQHKFLVNVLKKHISQE